MIGIFDSGSGGLTILKTLRVRMPDQDFVYLGDHRHAPYGHRSNDDIVELTRAGVDHLMGMGCKLVILACNTAAAVALRTLQQDWLEQAYPGRRILGVLVPMVEAVTGIPWHQSEPSDDSRRDRRLITLFATRKTVDSGAFAEELSKRAPSLTLISKACPGLVDAIEGGAGPVPLTGLVSGYVEETLELGGAPDAVILGCTHFPLVENAFTAALPAETRIYSQPIVVSKALDYYLQRHPSYKTGGSGQLICLSTDPTIAPSLGDISDVRALFLSEDLANFQKAAY